jgi:hypothetical protein
VEAIKALEREVRESSVRRTRFSESVSLFRGGSSTALSRSDFRLAKLALNEA